MTLEALFLLVFAGRYVYKSHPILVLRGLKNKRLFYFRCVATMQPHCVNIGCNDKTTAQPPK